METSVRGDSKGGTLRTDDNWSMVAAELDELARDGDLTEFGRRVCELVGAGRMAGLAEAIDALPTSSPAPLAMRMLRADLATRDQSIELHELIALENEARSANDPVMSLWGTAVMAEWGLWRGDFATFASVFGATPDVPANDPLGALAEGRRRRIATLVAMVTDPTAPATIAAAADVRTRFEITGVAEELAITDCVLGYARLSISDDLTPEPLEEIRRGTARLEELGADRLPIGLAFLSWSTYMRGEFVECADALDQFEEVTADGAVMPPVVAEGVAILHALSRLILDGVTDQVLDLLRWHLDLLRHSTVPTWFVGPVASDLIDHGQVELASQLHDAAASVPNVVRAAHQSIREVNARIRILRDRDPTAVDDLWGLYGDWESSGRLRRAAASAVRCSWSCRLSGMEGHADRLMAWGLERLPDPAERTVWEWRYVAGPVSPTTTRRGSLRVLVPDVVVGRGEREILLGDMQARLMAVLAAARRPVTTDWIVTALWPEADLDAGRNRLAALIHRIRQRLELLPDELLRRTRHGLELDGHGWSIDVWNFWDLSLGTPEDQERALDLYQADLAGRQLAYDDLLEEQREVLRNRWVDVVRLLVERGRMTAQEAQDRAHRVGTQFALDR
ncbi:MAG: hypothetical protein IT195_03595 [Microthrixaceae bacterium]|nr:hypothetical protein [Microthrixaceae bacterium]